MFSHKWLNITEAADYLRVGEALLLDELTNGQIPYSEFGGKLLFNTDQLDRFLLDIQAEPCPKESELTFEHDVEPMADPCAPTEKDVSSDGPARHRKVFDPQDFMQQACRLWNDGEKFTAHFRTKGASCQFKGEPRLWIFERKFHVPGEGKGNYLQEQIRKSLAKHFPQVTGKATVHINRIAFSWQKFVAFVEEVKEICNESSPCGLDEERRAEQVSFTTEQKRSARQALSQVELQVSPEEAPSACLSLRG